MGPCSDLATTRHRMAGSGRARLARPGWVRPGRRLHLVDVENLVGSGRPQAPDLAWCERTYRKLAITAPDDLVVVATNPFVVLDVGGAWPSCRLRIGHGPDGADRVLLRALAEERIHQRFDQVVIASGDGIFVDPVVQLQRQGVQVTVVARPSALSSRLRLAATRCIAFPPTPASDPAALTAA